MFVLYLSWPVLPSLINSVHYRDSKKAVYQGEREREVPGNTGPQRRIWGTDPNAGISD